MNDDPLHDALAAIQSAVMRHAAAQKVLAAAEIEAATAEFAVEQAQAQLYAVLSPELPV